MSEGFFKISDRRRSSHVVSVSVEIAVRSEVALDDALTSVRFALGNHNIVALPSADMAAEINFKKEKGEW